MNRKGSEDIALVVCNTCPAALQNAKLNEENEILLHNQ
jgi:predicted metal-binding protein